MRQRVWGVDFSGAKDAGDRCWLARARTSEGGLVLEALLPARALPGSGRSPEACLPAIRRLVASEPAAAFGFDFPFALSTEVVGEASWVSWVEGFAARYPTPEAFRARCREATGGLEIKRETDRLARVPFNGFNLRVYRQTYFGLRDVLAPLVAKQAACVKPMQPSCDDRAWVFEVCPASTLKRLGLYHDARGRPRSYKGPGPERLAARRALLAGLTAAYGLRFEASAEPALADAGGDALDAIACACATAEAAAAAPEAIPETCRARAETEGYIYF